MVSGALQKPSVFLPRLWRGYITRCMQFATLAQMPSALRKHAGRYTKQCLKRINGHESKKNPNAEGIDRQ